MRDRSRDAVADLAFKDGRAEAVLTVANARLCLIRIRIFMT